MGVKALPGVVMMGGKGRKRVLRASQSVVGAGFRKYNGRSSEAGQRRGGGLYGDVVGDWVVVLLRILGVMIADPGNSDDTSGE